MSVKGALPCQIIFYLQCIDKWMLSSNGNHSSCEGQVASNLAELHQQELLATGKEATHS